jgi:transcriptional regulator with XRE-family HTH domain
MTYLIASPQELVRLVAERAKARRLKLGRRQADLAEAAGLALSTIQRFESGRDIGFEALAKIALALGAEDGLAALFPEPEVRSIDEVLRGQRKRKRIRKPR